MIRRSWCQRWWGLVGAGSFTMACAAHAPSSEAKQTQSTTHELAEDEIYRLWLEGVTLGKQRRYLEAEGPLRQAVVKSRAIQGTDPKPLLRSLAALGSCLVSLQRPEDARAVIREALPLATPGTLEGDPMLYRLNVSLAESFRLERQHEQAVAPFQAAFEAARRLPAKHSAGVVDAAARLADTLDLLQRHRDVVAPLTAALPIAERGDLPKDYMERIVLQLAASHAKLGEHARASELLKPYDARGRKFQQSDATFVDLPALEALTVAAAATAPTETANDVATRAGRVASLRDSLRACHPAAVATGPDKTGEMRLVLSIEADGHVTETRGAWIGLPAATVDCVLQRAAAVRFDPLASATILTVPMSFSQRKE